MPPERKRKRPVSPAQSAAGASGSGQQEDEGQGQGEQEVIAERRQVIKAAFRGLVEAAQPDLSPEEVDAVVAQANQRMTMGSMQCCLAAVMSLTMWGLWSSRAEVQRLQDVEQSLMGTVDGLQGDLDDLQAAHQRLQDEHTALQQVASKTAATNHSLRAARRSLKCQVHNYRHKRRPHHSPLIFKQKQQLLVLEQHPVSVEVLRRLHLEQYYLACPISNAPVESLLQLLKHGGGRYMELPALLQLMSLHTCKEALKTVDVHDLQQHMGQLRAEVRRKEDATAAAQRSAKAERQITDAAHKVGRVVINVGDHACQQRLAAAHALALGGHDFSHTTVEEAKKMTGKQLQSYLQFHKQEVHTSWRVPKLLSHVCTHIRGKLAAAAPPQQQLTPAGTTPELAELAGAPPQQQQQLAAASTSRKRGAPAANKSRGAKQGATHNSVAKRAGFRNLCDAKSPDYDASRVALWPDRPRNASDRRVRYAVNLHGYTLAQLPSGFLATKLGGSRVLPAGVALWSAATCAVPPLSSTVIGLCTARAAVGLGEAVAPTAAIDMVANAVPAPERSRAVSFIFGGLHVGSILGLLACPWLIHNWGWQSVFFSFGASGLLWAAWFQWLRGSWQRHDPQFAALLKDNGPAVATQAAHSAEQAGRTRSAEAQPARPAAAGLAAQPIPYRAFLRSRPVQALGVTHFCHNFLHYTMLAWLPTYFTSTLAVDLAHAAQTALLPPLAGIIASATAGPLADWLISRGLPVPRVRKAIQGTSFLAPLALLLLACTEHVVHDRTASVACITAALGLSSFSLAGLYCTPQDLSPKYASALLSMSNTAGALPGVIGVTLVGMLYDATQSWQVALFMPSAVFMVIGAYAYCVHCRNTYIDFDDQGSKRTKAEQAAELTQPTKAAKAKPVPQPGKWLDRDCNAALNMQRIGESSLGVSAECTSHPHATNKYLV
ncbi:hypothetical protein QJQ45_028183 [Haematococcus lacustris]|nr:hypothetical protein QJQ45_028183 [Haematococcus lacustris]